VQENSDDVNNFSEFPRQNNWLLSFRMARQAHHFPREFNVCSDFFDAGAAARARVAVVSSGGLRRANLTDRWANERALTMLKVTSSHLWQGVL